MTAINKSLKNPFFLTIYCCIELFLYICKIITIFCITINA